MIDPKDKKKIKVPETNSSIQYPTNNEHLGSPNAFEETENPYSKDRDDISDEKLDEWVEE